jgi:hypothetical protein
MLLLLLVYLKFCCWLVAAAVAAVTLGALLVALVLRRRIPFCCRLCEDEVALEVELRVEQRVIEERLAVGMDTDDTDTDARVVKNAATLMWNLKREYYIGMI